EMSLALLRQTPGIAELRLLDQAETARLLEPWLGPAAAPATLPIPRLLDIRTESGAAIDITDLRQKLAAITPGAQLEDHRPALALHRRAATRAAILIALGIAAVAVFAVVLTVVATNLRLALHRGAVELLHLIGAGDADLAWPVQLAALRQGLVGGAIGAAAALLTLFVIGPLVPLDALPSAADWRLWGVALAVIAVAGFGAMRARPPNGCMARAIAACAWSPAGTMCSAASSNSGAPCRKRGSSRIRSTRIMSIRNAGGTGTGRRSSCSASTINISLPWRCRCC